VQSQQLKTIAEKITALFRLLDTTRERDVQRFIDTKGGAQACIKSDVTLKELAEKCGESLESLVPPRSEKTDATTTKKLLEDARKVLNKELMEDVNQAFIKHIDDFVRKLEAQENQLKAQITSAEKHIIAAYEGGPHVNVEDAVRDLTQCLSLYRGHSSLLVGAEKALGSAKVEKECRRARFCPRSERVLCL
jgi:hypothetical protein